MEYTANNSPLIVTPFVRRFVQLRHRGQPLTPFMFTRRRGTCRARPYHGPRRPGPLKGRGPLEAPGAHRGRCRRTVQLLDLLDLLLGLHPSVLEPDLDLTLRQTEAVRDL